MKITHISDTHGTYNFTIPTDSDIVIHSGDFLPDYKFRNKCRDLSVVDFQKQWIHSKAKKIKGSFKDKYFLFCSGNHDFVDGYEVEEILRNYDINAYCIDNQVLKIFDFKFYGFPYIPYIYGNWNYECSNDVLRNKTLEMVNRIKGQKIDVLVCHCPPYQILDSVIDMVENVGNLHLKNHFEYNLPIEDRPKWIMCGHIHCSNGIHTEWICNVSNAATTVHNIIIL